MVLFMKVNGEMIKLMEKEDLYIQMGMFMKEIGEVIKQKVSAYTPIKTVHNIKDNGKKINKMAREERLGQIQHSMKEII